MLRDMAVWLHRQMLQKGVEEKRSFSKGDTPSPALQQTMEFWLRNGLVAEGPRANSRLDKVL